MNQLVWVKRAAHLLLKDHMVICPDGSFRLVSCVHVYGGNAEVRFLDGKEPNFIWTAPGYKFPVLEEDWEPLLEEVKSLLPYVGLPREATYDWLTIDAWKQVDRAESLLAEHPDAAHLILLLIVQACGEYAISQRTYFPIYADRKRARAREDVEKAGQITPNYKERGVNLFIGVKAALLQAKAIREGEHPDIFEHDERYRQIVRKESLATLQKAK